MDVDLDMCSIPTAYNFSEVFLEELHGLPPPWEIEFSIDLLSRTQPISKLVYRMNHTELVKLENWLSKLLGQKFIHPSHSLGVPQCYS